MSQTLRNMLSGIRPEHLRLSIEELDIPKKAVGNFRYHNLFTLFHILRSDEYEYGLMHGIGDKKTTFNMLLQSYGVRLGAIKDEILEVFETSGNEDDVRLVAVIKALSRELEDKNCEQSVAIMAKFLDQDDIIWPKRTTMPSNEGISYTFTLSTRHKTLLNRAGVDPNDLAGSLNAAFERTILEEIGKTTVETFDTDDGPGMKEV